MKKGFMGKILMVDLTRGSIKEELIREEVYRSVTSGIGLAAWLLYRRIPAGADPLGPDNILAFMSGLLTGSGAWFSGRWMVAAKSPLTGGWGDANCGGTFSPAIKRCGYDGIFFKGISRRPVYLAVRDGKAKLHDASHLWGLDAVESEERLAAELKDPHARIAVIGPAGEKKSLIAGISNDRGRYAGRSGLGAVMGAKRLKAVVLSGTGRIEVHDPAAVKDLNKKFMKWFNAGSGLKKVLSAKALNVMAKFLRVSPVGMAQNADLVKLAMGRFGTIATNVLSSENGDSPVKNWQGAGFRDFPIATHADRLNPQRIVDHEVKKYHCYNCPLGCGGILKVEKAGLAETHKPEYETCCAFGALQLNNDLDAIFKINDYCNRAGFDTIGAGNTVAFAMECYERGIITKKDTGGLDLAWGNSEAVLALLEMMAKRKGFGNVLADGARKAAERIGRGSGKFAIHAGGQDLPMHDSRFDPGFAVAYSLEPTPGRHTNHGYQWLEMFSLHRIFRKLPGTSTLYRVEGKYRVTRDRSALLAAGSKYMQLVNGAGVCLFGAQMGGHINLPAYINAVTGWGLDPEEYLKIGERIQNIRQAFNLKQGLRPRRDFALPERSAGTPPLDAGPMKGVTLNVKELCDSFLDEMGWDRETGAPTAGKLRDLGLEDIAQELFNHVVRKRKKAG
ncbi:MAG: aldehyde ferredoxin oxidoreductase family protein [Spirochaetes bacterium]|nr:aldehyde ferredoxin oxidoreductase family protein [Spirochaetota bacterium]